MICLLGPQISSHALSRHNMICLSVSQISSHLSRFIFDMTARKIELFIEKMSRQRAPGQAKRTTLVDRRTADIPDPCVYYLHALEFAG